MSLGKKGQDYIMDDDIEKIIDSHDGDTQQMKYTLLGLNVEIQYIRESRNLSHEEKISAVQRYKKVIEALRKVIDGEEQ
jgi:hypothetical protein